MTDYFRHYADMNNINPSDEAGLRLFYRSAGEYYERELLPYTGNPAGKRVLDAGCGIGAALYVLRSRQCASLAGMDASEEQIAVCRKFAFPGAELGSLPEYLKGKREAYDLIILYDVLEHLPVPQIPDVITALYASLAPGGRVVARTPNMASPFAARMRYNDLTHTTGFTPQSLRQAFYAAPFSAAAVHNAYIGKKRKAAILLLQKLLCRLYNMPESSIVTDNIVITADR